MHRNAERQKSDTGLSYDGEDAERDNIRKKPRPAERYKCKYCRCKYYTKNGLQRHIENHGEYGFQIFRFSL